MTFCIVSLIIIIWKYSGLQLHAVKCNCAIIIIGPEDVDFFDEGTRMRIRPGVTKPEIISLSHRVDGVSQEIDETYILIINIESGSFEPDQLVSVLTVTIIDSNSKFREVVHTLSTLP